MDAPVSIAIETTCRQGGLALGAGGRLIDTLAFDARRRHATLLIGKLDELLTAGKLQPTDVDEVYVSLGPGSFTGIRVGVTVARTYAQARPGLRCVGVPTPSAVAENARTLDWTGLTHVHDAKADRVYVTGFTRAENGTPQQAGPSRVVSDDEFLESLDAPTLLIGEGLGYHELDHPLATRADEPLWLPTPTGVWAVGQRMAAAGEFTEYHLLLPHYTRKPEAVRLWEQRGKQ
jgi:tRNA threonylcarbamoyladenosine biosynthesis protein TsaB